MKAGAYSFPNLVQKLRALKRIRNQGYNRRDASARPLYHRYVKNNEKNVPIYRRLTGRLLTLTDITYLGLCLLREEIPEIAMEPVLARVLRVAVVCREVPV